MKTIVLTGGGTAGHVMPHLALIPRLMSDGWNIHYIGTENGIERNIIEKIDGVAYHSVKSGKLRRYFDIKNFTDPFRVIAGCGEAFSLMGKLKPNVVFSKGGFVSVPVAAAAGLRGIPLVLHESDMTSGLSNKLSMPFAKAICTTFPETAKQLGHKAVPSGTPLRPALFEGDRQRGLKTFGFSGNKPVLLVTGGSLGAVSVNTALRKELPLLGAFDILHLCGKGNTDEELLERGGYVQREFLHDEMADAYAMADVILSRAGSNTICEILAMAKPNVLIPYPATASRGDQIDNASSFERRGFSKVLLQENMTPGSISRDIFDVYNRRGQYIDAMKAEPLANGVDIVLEQIYKYAKK
ncbi:MAG: undecaprenyldiphospho-muramoylpentapeptide beta-N-acetylglucosaminyltransferase [Clostridiales bacterium]|nr:undecaprenyldiphospho-muramoylpentapeptide beta-N-acetylglucosaminyltransferase [Clostridiales bacterium]MBQ2816575.1 undecaprenyldiphospho-muramoylpentapeptide beta-N-acetylglucosaminyltransferase [Clostridia bacterium]MBQ4637571.1 undecaprenyldiphospho-muramoylpentapeptide beta-N-acetylglucosaminyltransferase [Clostridia bacterium]